MKLHEYQSKIIFKKNGIPVPNGKVTSNASEAKSIAEEISDRVVIKAQVLVSGRGKAGGIRLSKDISNVEEIATQILGMDVKGLPVKKILIEEAISINKEIYVGITNDRRSRKAVLLVSSEGGIDIEDIARKFPEKIFKVHIDPALGLRDFQIRDVATNIRLPGHLLRDFVKICKNLWEIFQQNDALLAEINPLVITKEERLLVLDAKMEIDENALFRHPDLADIKDNGTENPVELEAQKYGLSYIQLEGNIGCMVNGAGLAMSTMDIIKHFGGRPANFLDIGGGASAEKVSVAFKTILSDPNVKVILVNIFGGITRCDEVAKGILQAMENNHINTPLIVRLIGTNSEEGMSLLSEKNIYTANSLNEAAKTAIQVLEEVFV